VRHVVILAIGRTLDSLGDVESDPDIPVRKITWDDVTGWLPPAIQAEFRSYFEWRDRYAQRT